MNEALKLTSIGSGSTYTPDLADILIKRKDDFPVKDWALMDIDPKRLEIIGRYTKNMLEEAGLDIKVTLTTDLVEAVKDANFVIPTIRVGSIQGRILDETIPQKYGLIGQETTAPGGLAMGLRNIPAILNIAKTMESYSAPDAWLINLSNPAGMLAEALNQHSKVNFAGLCNGPTVIREAIQSVYSQQSDKIMIKIVGLNHLVWSKVYVDGIDVTFDTVDLLNDWFAENLPPIRVEAADLEIHRFAGWIPVGPYLKYYYEFDESIEDLKNMTSKWPGMKKFLQKQIGEDLLSNDDLENAPTRAHMVQILEKKSLELYAKGDKTAYALVSKSRGGRGYGEAGLSLASAIWNDKNEIHGPDVRHGGAIQGLDPTVVATTTALVNKAGIHPLVVEELPPHAMAFIQSAKKYELLAVEAAVTGNYHPALEALLANPLVTSFKNARDCLNELLIAHKEYLPNFADVIEKLERKESPLP